MSGAPIMHGTHSGAIAHQKRGEKKCEKCRVAYNEYMRDRRANDPDAKRRQYEANRAQNLAKTRLLNMYKDEYDFLYRSALAEIRGVEL